MQALAIRTGKIYLQELPELDRKPVELFLDIEGVRVDSTVSELNGALGAMGNDVDRVDIAECLQGLANLPDAVTVSVKPYNLQLAIIAVGSAQGFDQFIGIGNTRINEDNLKASPLFLDDILAGRYFEVLVED